MPGRCDFLSAHCYVNMFLFSEHWYMDYGCMDIQSTQKGKMTCIYNFTQHSLKVLVSTRKYK